MPPPYGTPDRRPFVTIGVRWDIPRISIWPAVGLLSYCLTMNELRSRGRVAAGGHSSVDAVRDPAKGA